MTIPTTESLNIYSQIITINPKTILYLDNPSDELKLKVLQLSIGNPKYISGQNVECCEFVAKTLYNNYGSCLVSKEVDDPFTGKNVLRGIVTIRQLMVIDLSHLGRETIKELPVHVNDLIVDLLIKIPNFIKRMKDIPDTYWNTDRIIILMKHNQQILKRFPDAIFFTQEAYTTAF